ncbi:MAG: phosphoribosylanthranilate isomerase [Ginsengibacter sp.]
MIIKVCGNTDLSQLKGLEKMGVDYAGLIFYDPSPRAVLNKLDAEKVKELSIKKVGVFVNEEVSFILEKVEEFGLSVVQLHGDETPSFCSLVSDHVKVIKAFRIQEKHVDIDWMVKEYDEVCDYYLFDKGSKGLYGGTGEKFNWDVLQESKIDKPFFLSGGIEIEDAERLIAFQHPFFYGIDINTRFEINPGIKDMAKVREFVTILKQKV